MEITYINHVHEQQSYSAYGRVSTLAFLDATLCDCCENGMKYTLGDFCESKEKHKLGILIMIHFSSALYFTEKYTNL